MVDPKKLEALIWETRARVTWGESPAAIAEWLTEEGVERPSIDEVIAACLKERAVEVRKRGIAELLMGSGILSAAVVVVVALISVNFMSSKVFAFGVIGVVYGIFKILRGVEWLIRGGKIRGSLTQLDQEII